MFFSDHLDKIASRAYTHLDYDYYNFKNQKRDGNFEDKEFEFVNGPTHGAGLRKYQRQLELQRITLN
jgi:hypothetical protein